MTVLGIDSATQVCSAAVVQDGEVVARCLEVAPQRHAELLLPFVHDVMTKSRLKPHDLDRIAVSIGPGSFTGLRIGLSVAKGIAAGAGIPIVPVPTMDSAAFRAFQIDGEANDVAVILPARRNEYYYGRYRRTEGLPDLVSGIVVYTTGDLISVLSGQKPDVVAGEGIERLITEIDKDEPVAGELIDILMRSKVKTLHLNDAAMTAIISDYYEKAETAELVPFYIKEFESGSPKHKPLPRQPE